MLGTRRTRGLAGRLRAAIAIAALVTVGVNGGPADAEPTAERHTIVVFGDSQGQGVALGLQRVLVEDSRYRVLNRTHPGAALVHGDSEWLAPVRRFLAREHADIAIVVFGANDRLDMRDDDGAHLHFRSDAWRKAYAARTDEILSALTDASLAVIWCGNPIARSPTYSADMSYINDIYAEEAARFHARFLSLWSVVTDGEGHYTAYGKNRDGVTERLRGDDGIHFTAAGYELVAEKIIALLSAPAPNAP